MLLTQIERIDQKRDRIYVDGEFVLLLYVTDIRRYRLEEEMEITIEKVEEIYHDVVLRRAKLKAMQLLKSMDYSEKGLRDKLAKLYYPPRAINEALDYVIGYGYIDDSRYARNYIRFKKDSQSKKQIMYTLNQKGVSKERIELAFEEEYDNEENAIIRAIVKKIGSLERLEELTDTEKQKVAAYLFRKGFSSSEIREYISWG
ncbi:regulatory protein RecX [Anaerosporobacter faecicola]|uniref:regulatory protein RecX n=1 Tax=Anaerosporobacter faecicola TaxID=2718714 RepID=UPI001438D6B6|nr:regulatory protein RecX [Anaerosporobacter faecicola]